MLKLLNFILFVTISYSLSFKNRLIYPTHDAFTYYIGPYLNSKSIAKVYNDFHKIDSKFTLKKCFPELSLDTYKLFLYHKPQNDSQLLYHVLFGNQNVIFCTKTKIARALKKECQITEFLTKENMLMLVDENIVDTHIECEMGENKKALIFYFENKFALFAKIEHKLVFICLGKNCFPCDDSKLVLKRLFDVPQFEFPTDLHYFFKAKFSTHKCEFFLKIFGWNQILIEKYNNFLSNTYKKIEKCLNSLPKYFLALYYFLYSGPNMFIGIYVAHFPYTIQSLVFTLPIWFFGDRCTFIYTAALAPIMPALACLQNSLDFKSAGLYPKRIDILAALSKSKKNAFEWNVTAALLSFLSAALTILSNFFILYFLEKIGDYDFCLSTSTK